jgi:Reverse transcriptase (RNA-dependent DNA polymerase)
VATEAVFITAVIDAMEGREVAIVDLPGAFVQAEMDKLFWKKLIGKLQEWGFEMNPYDACVANKIVNSKQLTVAWHVDDIKVSHVEVQVVDAFINQLEAEFGSNTPLNKSRGKVHDYLGMILDFNTAGEVTISMSNYIAMVFMKFQMI